MRLSTMRNETITAFHKVFKMLFTYITHVQQSLMLCPKFLSKKIHRITSIMSINYMTPRQPYKMNKVRKNIPLLRYDIVFSKIYRMHGITDKNYVITKIPYAMNKIRAYGSVSSLQY